MSLPRLTAEPPPRVGRTGFGANRPTPASDAVVPQACSVLNKIACGGAFVACGASCLLGPEICVPCLSAVGATNCLNCLLDW